MRLPHLMVRKHFIGSGNKACTARLKYRSQLVFGYQASKCVIDGIKQVAVLELPGKGDHRFKILEK